MPTENDTVTDAVVARIDERTKSIQTELVQIRIDLKENLDVVVDKIRDVEKRQEEEIGEVKKNHAELVKKVDSELVRKEDFSLIQKIVYGFVGLIVVSVMGALIATVIVQPKGEKFHVPSISTIEK
jgi:hypothetical protein